MINNLPSPPLQYNWICPPPPPNFTNEC
jgi:hypothetical protein